MGGSQHALTSANGQSAVFASGLSKYYGWHCALKSVTLQVPMGAAFLLVGQNGAGKSSLIKILVDLIRPSGGAVSVFGLNPQAHPAHVRANIGYVPEELKWGYGWMRVGRLLEHHAQYFPSWDKQYAKSLADVFALRLDAKVGTLSKGQGRRMHLVMALAHRPPLLVLDEPTDGLDPYMREGALEVIRAHLAATSTTLLITTHHAGEVEDIVDHVGVLRSGEVVLQMPVARLREQLHRYQASIPQGWAGDGLSNDVVLRRLSTSDQLDIIAWGDQSTVTNALAEAGAASIESRTATLHEATMAFLAPKRLER